MEDEKTLTPEEKQSVVDGVMKIQELLMLPAEKIAEELESLVRGLGLTEEREHQLMEAPVVSELCEDVATLQKYFARDVEEWKSNPTSSATGYLVELFGKLLRVERPLHILWALGKNAVDDDWKSAGDVVEVAIQQASLVMGDVIAEAMRASMREEKDHVAVAYCFFVGMVRCGKALNFIATLDEPGVVQSNVVKQVFDLPWAEFKSRLVGEGDDSHLPFDIVDAADSDSDNDA